MAKSLQKKTRLMLLSISEFTLQIRFFDESINDFAFFIEFCIVFMVFLRFIFLSALFQYSKKLFVKLETTFLDLYRLLIPKWKKNYFKHQKLEISAKSAKF